MRPLDPKKLERIDELQVDRAVQGLTPEETAELERLLTEAGLEDDDVAERIAASVDLSFGPTEHEPLPADLRSKVVADAEKYFATELTAARPERAAPRRTPAPAPVPSQLHADPGPAASGRVTPERSAAGFAWWLAAAAVVLALVGWWPEISGSATIDPTQQRVELLAKADTVRLDWSTTEYAPDASGDVVWSQDSQRGFMRIAGLPKNDPTVSQYQLWIFDDTQEHPVDGGVFDVDVETGEVLVPIDAKLIVQQPKVFAITVEKPGGVVVSKQETIALLAQV